MKFSKLIKMYPKHNPIFMLLSLLTLNTNVRVLVMIGKIL